MAANIGKNDRIARVLLGFSIFGLGYYFQSYWGFIGIVPLATAAIGWCPIYLPFHVSTVTKRGAK